MSTDEEQLDHATGRELEAQAARVRVRRVAGESDDDLRARARAALAAGIRRFSADELATIRREEAGGDR